jgi:hypothetical protein
MTSKETAAALVRLEQRNLALASESAKARAALVLIERQLHNGISPKRK